MTLARRHRWVPLALIAAVMGVVALLWAPAVQQPAEAPDTASESPVAVPMARLPVSPSAAPPSMPVDAGQPTPAVGAAGWVWVSCPLGEGVESLGGGEAVTQWVGADGRPWLNVAQVTVRDGEVRVPFRRRATRITLDVAGYLPVELHIVDDGGELRCEVGEFRAAAAVVGEVRPSWGEIHVEACGRRVLVEDDGHFFAEVPVGEPCPLQPFRRDGGLSIPGERVELVAEAGIENRIVLHLPDHLFAGFGIEIAQVEEGFEVLRVRRDGGAHLGGMQSGDLLLAIDGHPLAGEPTPLPFTLGPEGSEAEALVDRDGELLSLAVERRFLEPPQRGVPDPRNPHRFVSEDLPDAWVEP